MISTIAINSLTIGSGTDYTITGAKGFASADVRVSQYNVPGKHYAEVPRTFWGARKMFITVRARKDSVANYRTARDDLLYAYDLPRRGESTMTIVTTDGLNVQADVNLRSPITGDFNPGHLTFGDFIIELIAEDPVFYGTSESSQDITDGNTQVINNAGKAPVYPTLEIHGAITDPDCENQTTSETLTYTGTIANGTYVEVNTKLETATLQAAGTNVLDNVSGDFFQVQPGNNTIGFDGDSPGVNAKLTIKWRNGYIGI